MSALIEALERNNTEKRREIELLREEHDKRIAALYRGLVSDTFISELKALNDGKTVVTSIPFTDYLDDLKPYGELPAYRCIDAIAFTEATGYGEGYKGLGYNMEADQNDDGKYTYKVYYLKEDDEDDEAFINRLTLMKPQLIWETSDPLCLNYARSTEFLPHRNVHLGYMWGPVTVIHPDTTKV